MHLLPSAFKALLLLQLAACAIASPLSLPPRSEETTIPEPALPPPTRTTSSSISLAPEAAYLAPRSPAASPAASPEAAPQATCVNAGSGNVGCNNSGIGNTGTSNSGINNCGTGQSGVGVGCYNADGVYTTIWAVAATPVVVVSPAVVETPVYTPTVTPINVIATTLTGEGSMYTVIGLDAARGDCAYWRSQGFRCSGAGKVGSAVGLAGVIAAGLGAWLVVV